MKGPAPIAFFSAIFYPLFIASLFAQTPCDSIYWSTDPATNLNISPWGQNPKACSDGEGGAFVMWNANTPFTPQFLQYVNRCGEVMWSQPVEIWGNAPGASYFPAITEDGFGGALIAYTEHDFDGFDFIDDRVRLNRVDRQGNLLWGPVGVRASLLERDQDSSPQLTSDGTGGLFVSFTVPDDSIFIQRISPAGERLWGEAGKLVTNEMGGSDRHRVAASDSGGAIIHWLGYDTGFKRFDNQGTQLWYQPTPEMFLFYSRMISDNQGGVIASGANPTLLRPVVVNRVSADGQLLWGNDGIVLDDSSYVSQLPGVNIALDENNDATFVWRKQINNELTMHTQKVLPDGSIFWSENLPISSNPEERWGAQILNSDNLSNIYVWRDFRHGSTSQLYAQKLDISGQMLWGKDDIRISFFHPTDFNLIHDAYKGLLVVWSDEPLHGIFAQQISRNGNLGEILDSLPMAITTTPETTENFTLFQNYPNPFNPSTIIQFYLPKSEKVELKIFDILGQELKTLISEELPPGLHKVLWHGTNATNELIASGVYVYQLKTATYFESKKMLLLR